MDADKGHRSLMSHDSFLFIHTTTSAGTLIEELISVYGLERGDKWITSRNLSIAVRRWTASDRDLSHIEFSPASLTRKFAPRSSAEGFALQSRVLAGVLSMCSGDASFEFSEGGVELLRRGNEVYIDPDSIREEVLATNGYYPDSIVRGIPAHLMPL